MKYSRISLVQWISQACDIRGSIIAAVAEERHRYINKRRRGEALFDAANLRGHVGPRQIRVIISQPLINPTAIYEF